jgi:hypothetical protein
MKTLFSLLLLLSTTIVMASTVSREFECNPSGSEVRYEDTFLIKVKTDNSAQVLYKRVLNYRGNITTTNYDYIRGCYHAKLITESSPSFNLKVECDKDGQEGSVELNVETMSGFIYFYMPQIGYSERTYLNLNCRKLQ